MGQHSLFVHFEALGITWWLTCFPGLKYITAVSDCLLNPKSFCLSPNFFYTSLYCFFLALSVLLALDTVLTVAVQVIILLKHFIIIRIEKIYSSSE